MKYRHLEKGEIVREGDEVLMPDENAVWEPVKGRINMPAPDPIYPAHCTYRRYEPEIKCGTFKTDEENGITPEIRARMDADREKARGEGNK